MLPLASQADMPQPLLFRIEAMNFSLRLSNSCMRFNDSSADNLARGGRWIFISLMSFNLLAINILRCLPMLCLFYHQVIVHNAQKCSPLTRSRAAVSAGIAGVSIGSKLSL